MTKWRVLVRELESAGFEAMKGTKHAKFCKGSLTITVPRHREIEERTANIIRKQAGLK